MKYTKRGSGPLSLPPRNTCDAQGNPARPPGIEGVEMRKVYYNLMPRAALRIPLVAAGLLGSFAGAQQSPLPTASLESVRNRDCCAPANEPRDRKSTRLHSSH